MSNQKKKGMNLPNKLTVLRVCLVPVFIVVMMLPASVLDPIISGLIGVAIFIAASFTDMLDGKIARKFNQISALGKLLDPIADKLSQITIAVVFYLTFRNSADETVKTFSWIFLIFIIISIIFAFFIPFLMDCFNEWLFRFAYTSSACYNIVLEDLMGIERSDISCISHCSEFFDCISKAVDVFRTDFSTFSTACT